MSGRDPEPQCWNCFIRASQAKLWRDGVRFICELCQSEIEDIMMQTPSRQLDAGKMLGDNHPTYQTPNDL